MNTTPTHQYVGFTGIVDKVRAIRNGDEVQYLEATVHITMGEDYVGQYGGKVTTDLVVPLPVTTEINPGHVVTVSFDFASPFGNRFAGALTVGNEDETEDDEDDDVLEVMVEDGMVAEAGDEA